MIQHCAHCRYNYNGLAGTHEKCFYYTEKDYAGRQERKPCRELTEYGATYRCFDGNSMRCSDEADADAAVDWALDAIDRLEYRLSVIEDGIRRAAKRG